MVGDGEKWVESEMGHDIVFLQRRDERSSSDLGENMEVVCTQIYCGAIWLLTLESLIPQFQ